MKGFTEIRDIDEKILLEMDDDNLEEVCLTSKYISSICKSDTFWINRILHYFGKESLSKKPENLKWRDYYYILNKPIFENNTMIYELRDENNTIYQVKDNVVQFLKEAKLGMYEGKPLRENLTEMAGITTLKNLILLIDIHLILEKSESTTPVMNKYFAQELTDLEATTTFKRTNLAPSTSIPKLARKLVKKRLVSNKLSKNLSPLTNNENTILKEIYKKRSNSAWN
jgi:hypothetical protein